MEQTETKNKKIFIGVGIAIVAFVVVIFFVMKQADVNPVAENVQNDPNPEVILNVNNENSTSSMEVSNTPLAETSDAILPETPIEKLKVPPVLNPPPNWKTVGTSVRHSIHVPETAKLLVNGKAFEYGDYLGAFYDVNGTLKIAGFLMWKGEADSLYLWGDDLNTPEKDGFSTGEKFKWKIWKNTEKKLYDANAEFFPVGYGSSTATGTWISSGVSTLKAINSY